MNLEGGWIVLSISSMTYYVAKFYTIPEEKERC